ncbi:MAG: hypothetical protein J6Y78_04465 [Paludibacteraceae bacterium]|nr:hypothetical protein [Paludibacteraceae bacterium]
MTEKRLTYDTANPLIFDVVILDADGNEYRILDISVKGNDFIGITIEKGNWK